MVSSLSFHQRRPLRYECSPVFSWETTVETFPEMACESELGGLMNLPLSGVFTS